MSARINMYNRVIQTVRIQVQAAEYGGLLAWRYGRVISIDKPSDLWVVIAAVKVVQPGLGIEIISAVAEGVDLGYMCIVLAVVLYVNTICRLT